MYPIFVQLCWVVAFVSAVFIRATGTVNIDKDKVVKRTGDM